MNNNKIIHLKLPIIVRELAKQIGIQPFRLIHDLMDMNVFAKRNQTITPEVTAAICKKYGYTLVVDLRS
jgi:translation initiation factor IF-2